MKRPLVVLAIAFVVGIGLGSLDLDGVALRGGVAAMALVAIGGLGLGIWRRFAEPLRILPLCLLLGFAGWASGRHDLRARMRREERYSGLTAGVVSVEGTVCGMPDWRITGRGDLHVYGMLRDVRVVCASRTVMLNRLAFYWAGPDTSLDADFGQGVVPFPGERWRIAGPLRSGVWGMARRYCGGWRVSARTVVRLAGAPRGSWSNGIFRLREQLAWRLTDGIRHHSAAVAVIRAMLLGDRGGMTGAMVSPFRHSGTLHVFAISGLHVGMIALLGVGVLRLTGVSRRVWPALMGPVLVGYVLISGSRPSSVRATVLLLLYLSGATFGRRPDGFSALSAAALLMLAWDPGGLRDPGFVLSYGVVLGLMIWTPPLLHGVEHVCRVRQSALDARARRLDGTAPDSRWLQWVFALRLGVRVRQAVAVTVAAWLTSLPLIAHYFGRVSWVALPANLLMTPLAFLAVMLGTASLGMGAFSLVVARWLNQANLGVVHSMLTVARCASALPAASLPVSPPQWVTACGALCMLGVGLWCRSRLQIRHDVFCDDEAA